MENLMTYLDKYAMLIVKTGVNVQKDDLVQLDISVNQAPLARLIVKKPMKQVQAKLFYGGQTIQSYESK